MYKIVNLNCFIELNEVPTFPSDTVQNLRKAVLAPVLYKPNILQALQRINFKFHRNCSVSNLLRDCDVAEEQTLLMFWGSRSSDSRVTISMSASSCSSLHAPANVNNTSSQRDRDLRSVALQTDISLRYSPGIGSPVNLTESEEQRLLRARIADSLTFSSPASSILQPTRRSMSILGSVCALLLNKRGSDAKEVSGISGSHSDNICRICFGGESAERLVRPCSCRGTIAAVHRTCLERWLLQAATSYCELCRHHYVVTRSHKWSWARSLVEWARSGRGRALAADAWRGAALGAASVLGTARALRTLYETALGETASWADTGE
nr:uncharacterized protein LOC113391471 [Vanessa tameamea]